VASPQASDRFGELIEAERGVPLAFTSGE